MYHDIRLRARGAVHAHLHRVIVPIQFVLALTMALLVNANPRGRGLFLFVFILPLGVSDLAAGLVWSSIFTEHGYLNTILQDLGIIDSRTSGSTRATERFSVEVVAAEMWRRTALIMVILIAGLQGIPKEYGEAAEVFGAGFFQRLRNVTLPMLKPAIQVALLLRIIFAFEVFATVLAITGQGDDDARAREPATGRATTSTLMSPPPTRR